MKERILFAAVAGLGLVSASPPSGNAAPADPTAYPACSRTVTDHCIQLYERGVRAPRAAAPQTVQAAPVRHTDGELSEVMAAPEEHPRIAMASAAGDVPCAAPCTVSSHRRVTQRVRRAGERG